MNYFSFDPFLINLIILYAFILISLIESEQYSLTIHMF